MEEAVGSPSSLVVCLVHTMARVTECRMTFRRICRWRLALLVCLLSGGRACAAVGADVRLLGDLGCAASVVYFAWIVLVAASSSTPVGDRRPYRDTCRRICRRLRSRVPKQEVSEVERGSGYRADFTTSSSYSAIVV